MKSVSLNGDRVVRTPLALEVLGENLFLFQLLVAFGVSCGDQAVLQDRINITRVWPRSKGGDIPPREEMNT